MYLYLLLIFLPLIGSFCTGLFGRKLGPSGASVITVSCLLFGFIIPHIFFHSNYSLFSNQYTVILVFLLVAILLENFLLFFQLLYILPMSFLSFITWRSYYQVFSSCKIYLRCCLICWYHPKEGSAAKIKKWVQHSTIALIVMVREPKKVAEAQPTEKDSVIDSAEEGLDVPNLPAIESVTQKPVRGSIQGLIDAFSTLQGPTTAAGVQSGQVYPMICSDGKVLVVHDPTLFSSVSAVYSPSLSPMVTQYYGVLPTMGDYHSVSLMLAQNYSRIPIMEQNQHVGLTVARNCCPIPPTLPISGIRDVSVEVGASPFDRVSVFSKSLASTAMQFPLGGGDQPLLGALPSDISNYANSSYMFSVEPLSPTVTLDHRSLPILNAYFQLNNLLTGCFRKDGVFILRGNHVHTGGKMSAAYPIHDDLEFCVVVSTLPEAHGSL